MKNSLKPAFHDTEGRMNEDLLTGLDRLLDEMAKRDMKAVIYLNNFWEWSGGMGTYLSWVNGGHYVDLGDPDHPWPEFPLFNMRFYENDAANEIYIDYVRALVVRVNSVNGRAYRDDPTIMAWQLANEPRPGYSTEPGLAVLEAYYKWIEDTSSFIKSLDPNHLVSTGSEGVVGCADNAACYIEAHNAPAIDYLTFHMWPKNWSWINGDDVQGSLGNVEGRAMEYMASHISMAERLNKPLVLEEFGFPRDDGALQVASSVDARDGFFRIIFRELERDVALGGPFSGTNFWTWGGEGRAEHADFLWQMEDVSYTGDPPQEPQGLNSVFDRDRTTLALLKQHGRELNRLGKNQSACGQRE
ncbi:MAG: hypothetical protein R3C13_10300 [Hyphomonas sp.]|uniref:glycoside hydrolase 5 family protein n=1 Tax=Hyphomonas sp. TaxID=87 RepID=UPI00352982C1